MSTIRVLRREGLTSCTLGASSEEFGRGKRKRILKHRKVSHYFFSYGRRDWGGGEGYKRMRVKKKNLLTDFSLVLIF